jgi:hypothetical protein
MKLKKKLKLSDTTVQMIQPLLDKGYSCTTSVSL